MHWALPSATQSFVTNFACDYIVLECCIRKLQPDSISGVYLPGIINILRLNSVPAADLLSAAVKSATFKFVRDGLERLYRKIHPKSESIKMAFSPAAARHMYALLSSGVLDNGCKHMSSNFSLLATLRLFSSTLFAISFLLRKSEMLFKLGKVHPPSRASVTFFDSRKVAIPHDLVGVDPSKPACWLRYNVHASKTDQIGAGRINLITAQPSGNCTVAVMERYFYLSHLAGAMEADSLFDIPGLPRLTAHTLSAVMKSTVTTIGLPAARVSTHSLRYGGATALAAGGFPEYIIAMYGGWKEGSTSLRRYTRPSADLVDSVSAHMHKMSNCNINDDLMTLFISKANAA